MLLRTLTPVVLVVILWVSMSSVTTYYMQWAERSHHRFYAENMVSIRAAETLQSLVWRLAAECPNEVASLPGFRLRLKTAEAQLAVERKQLEQSTLTDEERRVLSKLDSALTEFLERLHRIADLSKGNSPTVFESRDIAADRLLAIESAGRIAVSSDELLKINQALAEQDTSLRQAIGRVVFSSRLAMMVIGPIVGVVLGWRLALQLHRSIARIAVTLHDASTSSENDVGTVAIESTGDFHDVQQQAEQVVERMRQVSRDLQIARREVLQAERLAAVGELAAGVAHEIRNPLTSVKLLLQHAIRQAAGPQLDEEKLRLILDEIGRMETTIQGLLDFSRPPKLNRVVHDLRQTLHRALNLLDARIRQQQIQLTTQITDTPLMVDGDTEKLHQVLVNLLINAVEAMPDGGKLTITASLDTIRSADSSAGDGEDAELQIAQIEIRDTGEGIDSTVLPRLFEPFATTKERGTGLGLAVSHRIVEEHAGTIHAANVPGGGARLIIRIPTVKTLNPARITS